MNRSDFVKHCLQIASEKPSYRLGGDGSDGTCDCIGLCIGALRRGNIEYNGVHGTNWAKRHESVDFRSVHSVDDLNEGDCVLKAYAPDDERNNLPSRYANDPDQNDYYHVGVVTSLHPLKITHMTSPTAKTDTKLGSWRYAFTMRQLDGEDSNMDELYKAQVTLTSGSLNLRKSPGTDAERIGRIPNGAVVSVIVDGEWAFVRYNGMSGYVFAEYIQPIKDDKPKEEKTIFTDGKGNMFVLLGRWSAKVEVD